MPHADDNLPGLVVRMHLQTRRLECALVVGKTGPATGGLPAQDVAALICVFEIRHYDNLHSLEHRRETRCCLHFSHGTETKVTGPPTCIKVKTQNSCRAEPHLQIFFVIHPHSHYLTCSDAP